MTLPTMQEALDYAASRNVALPDEFYGKLAGVQRAQAVTISGLAQLEQIKAIIDALAAVMERGGTFQMFKQRVAALEQPVELPAYRLENIFRTNTQAAYSRGRFTQQLRTMHTRPFLMYSAIHDARVRPSHLAMDGTVLPMSHGWWATHYPPNGYMCRCTVVSLTAKQAERRGITQLPPTDADPDAGWDFNVGQLYGQGPATALAQAAATPGPQADAANRVAQAAEAAQALQNGAPRA